MSYKLILRIGTSICMLLLITSCATFTSTTNNHPPIAFMSVKAMYASYLDESFFIMNLPFTSDPSLEINDATVTDVEFLPLTNVVDLQSFDISASTTEPLDGRMHSSLHVHFEPDGVGTHTFTEVIFHTAEQQYRVPLGTAQVDIFDGDTANVFVLPQSGGIFGQTVPLKVRLENVASQPVQLQEVYLDHPSITFEAEDTMVADDTDTYSLAPDGFELMPGQKVTLWVDWEVTFPATGSVNMEIAPVLVVLENGVETYAYLQNMAFRSE
ncbi:MAG: hypothetical protein AAGF95_06775 [Chloroflexota bacterium]